MSIHIAQASLRTASLSLLIAIAQAYARNVDRGIPHKTPLEGILRIIANRANRGEE